VNRPDASFDPARLAEVEALVRLAGAYVDASDDLRPRVLDAVRLRRANGRRQKHLAVSALVVLGMACVLLGARFAFGDTMAKASSLRRSTDAIALRQSMGGVDGVWWYLVEAMFDVRRQNAEAFSAAPPNDG
jgi:hypothetical protein